MNIHHERRTEDLTGEQQALAEQKLAELEAIQRRRERAERAADKAFIIDILCYLAIFAILTSGLWLPPLILAATGRAM